MSMNLQKLMEKKKSSSKELDPANKAAKMSMLEALKHEMSGMMSNDLHPDNLKKVSVAAPDKEGLAEGLDKAKDLISSPAEENSEEVSESPSDESNEEDEEKKLMDAYQANPSKENLEALLSCLEEKKVELESEHNPLEKV